MCEVRYERKTLRKYNVEESNSSYEQTSAYNILEVRWTG